MATKSRRFKPETYTTDEISALLRACSRRYPTGLRNRALIALGYAGGLRVSEALSLRVRDVNLRTGEVYIQNGKGNKARTICINESACQIVGQWIERRRELKLRGPLLCTLAGKALSSAYVRTLLPRLGQKASLGKRVHYHGLRHSWAVENMRAGTPTNVIQKGLGHSSLKVTSIYLDHVGTDDLREAANAIPEF